MRNVLIRVGRLRAAGGFISEERWEARRAYWTAKEKGALRPDGPFLANAEDAAPANNPMANPAGAMEGMMGNASFMIQNMIMMQGIQHFFSGFVLLKVPFSLSRGFKPMFQRGIDLPSLNVSYVSSVSWYFLVMFGLRGLFRLIIGDPSRDSVDSTALQADLGNSFFLPAPLKSKDAFKAECDNLEIARYRSVIETSERILLGSKYPKGKKVGSTVKGKKGKNRGDDIFGDLGEMNDRKKNV